MLSPGFDSHPFTCNARAVRSLYNAGVCKLVNTMGFLSERDHGNSGVLPRLVWAALPILVVLFLLVVTMEASSDLTAFVAVCAVGGVVLWFGWGSVRRNIVTKWTGILLAVYLALVVGLFALGIAVKLSRVVFPALTLIVFPLLLVALPYLVYDLLFRAPHEGRLARARAARRHRFQP
jgi:hypothetical protein